MLTGNYIFTQFYSKSIEDTKSHLAEAAMDVNQCPVLLLYVQ